jgi:hypothetical protein
MKKWLTLVFVVACTVTIIMCCSWRWNSDTDNKYTNDFHHRRHQQQQQLLQAKTMMLMITRLMAMIPTHSCRLHNRHDHVHRDHEHVPNDHLHQPPAVTTNPTTTTAASSTIMTTTTTIADMATPTNQITLSATRNWIQLLLSRSMMTSIGSSNRRRRSNNMRHRNGKSSIIHDPIAATTASIDHQSAKFPFSLFEYSMTSMVRNM